MPAAPDPCRGERVAATHEAGPVEELRPTAALQPSETMSRLLSIVVLASLLAGFAGAPVSHAADLAPIVVVSQPGGHSGGPMTAMDCGACCSMGACIASPAASAAGVHGDGLPPRQPSLELFGRISAPETAPPKPSSI